MRVLVIGANGQVARSLAERAEHADATVVAAGRPETDLTDRDSLAAALDRTRPDVVINAAAYTAVDKAESEPDAANALNADGPAHLARLAADRDVPLIHLSTDYVFDGAGGAPYREDDAIAPRSVYGASKAAGERGVIDAGGRALVVRTAWVYSPFGGNFVKTMLRVGATRPELRVVDDQRGNPTNALVLADALLALAAAAPDWPATPDILHLAGGGEATWCAFAKAIFEASPFHPAVEAITTAEYKTPATRPEDARLSCEKVAERHAITLPHWRETLPQVVERIVRETVPAAG